MSPGEDKVGGVKVGVGAGAAGAGSDCIEEPGSDAGGVEGIVA